jgi:MFS family permease
MGPFIGDFVTEHKGWKWSQYTLAIFYLASWLPIFFLKETYLKVIMARRKRTQSVADTQGPKPAASTLLLGVLFITLLRPTKVLFMKPTVSFLSLYVAFNFAVIVTFLRPRRTNRTPAPKHALAKSTLIN